FYVRLRCACSFLRYFPTRRSSDLGAAAFPALVMVVVARYIPKENRGKAFGLIGSIVAMGEGVGPAIGGMIAHYIHWSYLLLIPMITIITVPFLMKLLK